MSEKLHKRRCEPCEGGVDPLSDEQVSHLMKALHDDWQLSDDGKWINRLFEFPAYSRSLGFCNAVAWIAIVEGHHPEIVLNYGRCEIRYSTHAIGGLSDNDFICAAKIDRLAAESI